jgi:hypothetical protein
MELYCFELTRVFRKAEQKDETGFMCRKSLNLLCIRGLSDAMHTIYLVDAKMLSSWRESNPTRLSHSSRKLKRGELQSSRVGYLRLRTIAIMLSFYMLACARSAFTIPDKNGISIISIHS